MEKKNIKKSIVQDFVVPFFLVLLAFTLTSSFIWIETNDCDTLIENSLPNHSALKITNLKVRFQLQDRDWNYTVDFLKDPINAPRNETTKSG